jgi:hypothetical protein
MGATFAAELAMLWELELLLEEPVLLEELGLPLEEPVLLEELALLLVELVLLADELVLLVFSGTLVLVPVPLHPNAVATSSHRTTWRKVRRGR